MGVSRKIKKISIFLIFLFFLSTYSLYSNAEVEKATGSEKSSDSEISVEQNIDLEASKESLSLILEQYGDKVLRDNGRIVKIISFDGTYDILTYSQQTGKVERIDTYTTQQTLLDTIVFYRDSVSGALLAIKHGNNRVYFVNVDENRKTYIKSTGAENNEYNTFFSSLILKGNAEDENEKIEYTDEGNLLIKNNDKISEYDKNGRVLRDNENYYEYSQDGILVSKSVIIDNLLIQKEYYKDGVLSSKDFFENGKISKKLIFYPSGNEEEYYENGVIYAKAKYALDNKKVLNIEYI